MPQNNTDNTQISPKQFFEYFFAFLSVCLISLGVEYEYGSGIAAIVAGAMIAFFIFLTVFVPQFCTFLIAYRAAKGGDR